MQQQPPPPEIFFNPLSLWTLSMRKISDSLAAHCGRGANFCELRDSVAQLQLPGPVRQALMTEDENIVCAESTDRLGRFLGRLKGTKGIAQTDIFDNEKRVCVHGRKNLVWINVRGDRNERELVFAEAAEAEEFWREFKWILCNAGHIVMLDLFCITGWSWIDDDLGFWIDGIWWPHNSYAWFPPTFFADLLKAALETETPTNFVRDIFVDIPPNAGVTDPTLQLIADQAQHQHIQLTSTREQDEEERGGRIEVRCYQLRNKKITEQTFKFDLVIKNGQLHNFQMRLRKY